MKNTTKEITPTIVVKTKKKWVRPNFEVISKKTVQGGTVPGAESTVHYS